MITPSLWVLNFWGEKALADESARWTIKRDTATGKDRADAQKYLDAVNAELEQRRAQYSGGVTGTILGALKAPFESLGGSGGAGATGLAGEVTGAASDVISGAGSFLQRNLLYIIGGAVIVAIAWVYFNKK